MAVKMQIFQREEIALALQERQEKGGGPVGRLRCLEKMLPGIVYGCHQEPMSFKVEARSLERALSQGGQNAIFLLPAANGQDVERTVVREIQYHKVSGDILHVDLLRIDSKAELRVQVPIVTRGEPEGVRTSGGALQQTLSRLEMQCLASELPSRVEIEISDLEIGDSVHVEELIEQDSRISTDPEVTIVSVLAPRLTVDEEIALAAEEEEVEEVEGEDAEGEAAEGEEAAAPEGEGEASGGESSS